MSVKSKLVAVFSGTTGAQVVTAVSIPIVARLYSPDAHAGWAMFLSLSLLFSSIAIFRYELAIVLPESRDTAASIAVGAIALAAATAIIAAIVIPLALYCFNAELACDMLVCSGFAAIAVFGTALFQIGVAWCTRESHFKIYALAQCLLPVVVLTVHASAAALGVTSATGLIAGTAAGQGIAGCVLASYVFGTYRRTFRSAVSYQSVKSALWGYKNFPIYMTPYTIVGIVRDRLIYFLLNHFATPAAAGLFALSSRVVNMPNSFVSGAMRPVFFQQAATRPHGAMEKPVLNTILLLASLGAVCWGPSAVHADWIFKRAFGPEWVGAAEYAVVLSVPAVALMAGNWADRLFDALGKQRVAFVLELSFSLLSVLSLIVGFYFLRSTFYAICLQAAVLTVYYCGWLIMLFKSAGYRVAPLVRGLVVATIVGLLSYSGCSWLRHSAGERASLLISASLAASIAGGAALVLWKRPAMLAR